MLFSINGVSENIKVFHYFLFPQKSSLRALWTRADAFNTVLVMKPGSPILSLNKPTFLFFFLEVRRGAEGEAEREFQAGLMPSVEPDKAFHFTDLSRNQELGA